VRGPCPTGVDTQHLAADSGEFNVKTGGPLRTRAREVKAGTPVERVHPVSPNPLTFEAQEVRRIDSRTYTIEHAG